MDEYIRAFFTGLIIGLLCCVLTFVGTYICTGSAWRDAVLESAKSGKPVMFDDDHNQYQVYRLVPRWREVEEVEHKRDDKGR